MFIETVTDHSPLDSLCSRVTEQPSDCKSPCMDDLSNPGGFIHSASVILLSGEGGKKSKKSQCTFVWLLPETAGLLLKALRRNLKRGKSIDYLS